MSYINLSGGPVDPDDFGGIQAAIDYTAANGGWVQLRPKPYYVSGTLYLRHHTRIIGYGAEIIGTTYMNSPQPIPAANDVIGQTAGACFSEEVNLSNTNQVTFSPHFEGFKVTGFKYAFCSIGYAWYHPVFRNISTEAVNLVFFGYQGMQNPKFENISGTFNCLIAGHATCFAADNPYKGLDNVFTDGVQVFGMGKSRPGVHTNTFFDDWFEQAILRPDTPSTWVAETRLYELTGSWRKVTGRLVYLPGRNRRMIFSLRIKDVSMETASRGLVCVRAPHDIDIENIGGENIFHNPLPAESMILTTPGSGTFKNIQTNEIDSSAKAKACIEVVEDTQYAYPFRSKYNALNCEGKILGAHEFASIIANQAAALFPNGPVGVGVTTMNTTAAFQIDSTDKGMLIPRMTKAQRMLIASPATGLLIYQTTNTPGLRQFNGVNWVKFTTTND